MLENEDPGEIVPIGELAHNVGWNDTSPRGDSPLTETERSAPENLILLCGTCHKPADDRGATGRYTVEFLAKRKRVHESRIRMLTAIGGDRHALVIRVVGAIRGALPELTYDTVLTATTAAGYFPQLLASQTRSAVELDLREFGEGTLESNRLCAQRIDDLAQRVHGAVLRDGVHRLAVFGFARIPVLVHLGARLDDKVNALIFQRQRTDRDNAWCWPDKPGPVPEFIIERMDLGGGLGRPVLVLNISGTIPFADLPQEIAACGAIYTLSPASPAASSPTVIDSPAALDAFEQALRDLFAELERRHGRVPDLPVFGAIPVSAAITLGRVLMPQVSPILRIFDRAHDGTFYPALEVSK